jgi:hypothetical protein
MGICKLKQRFFRPIRIVLGFYAECVINKAAEIQEVLEL